VEASRRSSALSVQLAESGAKEQATISEVARLKGEIARLRFALPQHAPPQHAPQGESQGGGRPPR